MTCEYSCAKIDRIKVKCVLFCKWLYQVESCRFVRSQVPDTRMLHQAKGKKSNLRCKVELISNENLRGQCLNKRVKFLFLPFHLIYLLLLLFFLSIKLKPRDNDYPSNVSLQVTTLLLAVWDALTDIDRTLNCFFSF